MRLHNFINKHIIYIILIAASYMVSACGNNPTYDETALTYAKKMYQQAASAQKRGDYNRAICLYDSLLHYNNADTAAYDSLLPIVSKAITQTMNTCLLYTSDAADE